MLKRIEPGLKRRLRPLTAITVCALTAAIALVGCQSEQEQKMAEARELIRQKSLLEASSAKPAAPDTSGQAGAADPAKPTTPTTSADALGMPIYPGAKPLTGGSGANTVAGDGMAMTLLETPDSVDKVVVFYNEKLKANAGKLQPFRSDGRHDGKRVVLISLPKDDGGLQTVQATEDGGKTTIELMNMKGKPGASLPSNIPGMPGQAAQGSAVPGSAEDPTGTDIPRGLRPSPSSSAGASGGGKPDDIRSSGSSSARPGDRDLPPSMRR